MNDERRYPKDWIPYFRPTFALLLALRQIQPPFSPCVSQPPPPAAVDLEPPIPPPFHVFSPCPTPAVLLPLKCPQGPSSAGLLRVQSKTLQRRLRLLQHRHPRLRVSYYCKKP